MCVIRLQSAASKSRPLSVHVTFAHQTHRRNDIPSSWGSLRLGLCCSGSIVQPSQANAVLQSCQHQRRQPLSAARAALLKLLQPLARCIKSNRSFSSAHHRVNFAVYSTPSWVRQGNSWKEAAVCPSPCGRSTTRRSAHTAASRVCCIHELGQLALCDSQLRPGCLLEVFLCDVHSSRCARSLTAIPRRMLQLLPQRRCSRPSEHRGSNACSTQLELTESIIVHVGGNRSS